MTIKERFAAYIHDLQDVICAGLEAADGTARFREDAWERPEGGGGKTRVIADGKVFEKGGVNTSVVHGPLPASMQNMLQAPESNFWACGLSLVIHPLNPYVPTVHANWRYFELYNLEGEKIDSWFGGGTDLTPYYIFEDDAIHFHRTLEQAIAPFGDTLYAAHKRKCDEYFRNTHRNNEMRGIGGVFYDYLKPNAEWDSERLFRFQQANGNAFLDGYLPIVARRKNLPFTERELLWQEVRRGRYVEFNLVHDRGTHFGLKTGGRTESILMSLPPRARWYYDYQPEPNSPEEHASRHYWPKDWLGLEKAE